MKIATYNIWNSEAGMPHRGACIIKEIQKTKADVICLQEVNSKETAESIAAMASYQYCFFDGYPNADEGLCILSKIPFQSCKSWLSNVNAIGCRLLHHSKKVHIVNVHLPWDSVAERERQITTIIGNIDEYQSDYVLLMGDFNCDDSSDVQRFLNGECLLSNTEAKPRWFDLASAYAEMNNTKPDCTLDFRKNPRFKRNTIETNSRFDRILLRNTYPCEFPILNQCCTFGQTIYESINLCASDHYGVTVSIE